jgi:N-acetylglucosamine-6-sulfatase
LLYEHYWERNFPQTPTIFALRGDRYKFVRAYGVWDCDELYDLANDPGETKNLIFDRDHAQIAQTMRQKLFATLDATDGMTLPLRADRGRSNNLRHESGSPAATFPPEMIRKK